MACDTRLKPRQTIQERAKEVREAVERLAAALRQGRVQVIVDRASGAVAFTGWDDTSRDGVSDACAYRALQHSPMFAALVARAQALAGRTVDKQAIAAGWHSHDGGKTFHRGH